MIMIRFRDQGRKDKTEAADRDQCKLRASQRPC